MTVKDDSVSLGAPFAVTGFALTGRVVENASNRGKGVRGEAVMKAVVAELVRNGPKAACFAAFEWAYENHLNELLLNVGAAHGREA